MKLSNGFLLGAFTSTFLFVGVLLAEDSRTPEPAPQVKLTKEQQQAWEDIEDLATAARLAALGNPENKDQSKCPEMLVAAAFLYKKLALAHPRKMDKPEVGGAQGSGSLVDKDLDAPNYEAMAQDLLDQAVAIGKERNIKLAIDALIKDMNSRKLERAVVGGPRQIKREIGPGQWQEFHIKVQASQPFMIGFKANKSFLIEIKREDTGMFFGAATIPYGSAIYSPGKGAVKEVPVIVRFQNPHKERAEFTLMLE